MKSLSEDQRYEKLRDERKKTEDGTGSFVDVVQGMMVQCQENQENQENQKVEVK